MDDSFLGGPKIDVPRPNEEVKAQVGALGSSTSYLENAYTRVSPEDLDKLRAIDIKTESDRSKIELGAYLQRKRIDAAYPPPPVVSPAFAIWKMVLEFVEKNPVKVLLILGAGVALAVYFDRRFRRGVNAGKRNRFQYE